MAEPALEQRVSTLEAALTTFLSEMAVVQRQAEERNRQAEERNRQAEERNRQAEERNRQAEERNRQAEERMTRFEEEMRQSRRQLDKKWGDLANKLGTIIEDILAPNLRHLASEHFKLGPIVSFAIRCQRRVGDAFAEFDTLVVGKDALIVGEAKSSPDRNAATDFGARLDSFFHFFPEYQGRKLIGVFGSWAIDPRVVTELTRHGIYAMQMGEETMVLLNARELEGGAWA